MLKTKAKSELLTGEHRDLVFDIVNYSLMTLVLIVILYPLIYVISASFSDPLRVASGHVDFTQEFYAGRIQAFIEL